MGFWLDMVFGKSPLQNELEVTHKKVAALNEAVKGLISAVDAQVDFNKNTHKALEAISDCNTEKSEFALRTVEEIDKLKARLDLLEANVVVHQRVKPVKMKPVKGGII